MYTREDALASIARRRAIDHPIHGIWVITVATDGRRIGNMPLKPIPLVGESVGGLEDAEIGRHLHTPPAALEDAFSQGLPKVLAVTDPDNHASQAVCLRLGMNHLGRTTKYHDTSNELFEKPPG